ncbi:hypothetical protein ACIRQQ_01115 [Streptomyces fuscichromogenes]|uniref:hypothetical protein n=1 Tax=Streptomyces fuscichromogenes TaxID=1324013 RepID=UPI00382F6432
MADTPISRYDVLGTVFFEGADEAPPVMSLATTGIGFRPHPAGAALAGRLRDRPGRPATPIATPVPVRRSVTPS